MIITNLQINCGFKEKQKSNKLINSLLLFSDPDGIRTHDPRLRRALLYPAELPDQFFVYNY